jgi:predicted dehydrogenase
MVGGGADSVIGATHRIAFRMDGGYDLVAGAMSIDPGIAAETGRMDLLEPDRIYTDFAEMAAREAERSDGIDVVVIATPPQIHFEVARTFLEHGIHVICEKPMTRTADEAQRLVDVVAGSGRLFLLTHCYTGYPMVREARALASGGALGQIRLIEGEFASGDPGLVLEPEDPAKRHWNLRPDSMGKAVMLGEIGSHLHNLTGYITGAQVTEVSAQLETLTERREVYDNAYLNVRFDNQASGRLWSSYVGVGHPHGLGLRIFGTEASIAWHQERPGILELRGFGSDVRILSRATPELSEEALAASRFRPGHPEGYALAFATLYRDFAGALMADALGEDPAPFLTCLPTVEDGLATLQLIEAAERSNDSATSWEELPPRRGLSGS